MQGGSLTPSREAAGHSVVLQLLETGGRPGHPHVAPASSREPRGAATGCGGVWREKNEGSEAAHPAREVITFRGGSWTSCHLALAAVTTRAQQRRVMLAGAS